MADYPHASPRGFYLKEKVKEKNKKYNVLVTAGPTREPLDPVRYISNWSTGTMGYEVASLSNDRGYEVCLVSGPVSILPPEGVEIVNVTTAIQMREEVLKRIDDADCLVMTAAVCDFRPQEEKSQKIKKRDELNMHLIKNPDILSELKEKKGLIKVGFALETENALENGRAKLKEKNLDLIFINTVGEDSDPFGPGEVEYTMVTRDERTRKFSGITKKEMAREILDEVERIV